MSGIDVLSNNQVRTSPSTRMLTVLSSPCYLLGQPYFFCIDCVGARISCLAENKMEVPFGILFFPPLLSGQLDTRLCIVTLFLYFQLDDDLLV